MSNNSILPSEIGVDIIGQSNEPVTVGEWLNANENNLVIKYKTKTNEVTHFLLDYNSVKKQFEENPRANQIKCPVSMASSVFNLTANPTTYMDLGLIGIVGVVIERNDIKQILSHILNKTSTRLYEIIPAAGVDDVNSMWTFVQSKIPETIRVAPKENEDAITRCDNGELFNGKLIEVNLKEELPEPQIEEQTNMPPEPPTEEALLGGKRKSVKKRKSTKKRKSVKKRKSTKKRKSVKK